MPSKSHIRRVVEPRELTDPRAMRALAHPLRLALLELVSQEGTLTSARASELTGESRGSCSFHLRQLAKYGFLEDAGGRDGRERPWRVAQIDTRWSPVHPDLERTAAADALVQRLIESGIEALANYLRLRRSYPPEWQHAGLMTTSLLFVKADELAAIEEELIGIVRRYIERAADPALRPDGAKAVRLVSFAAPLLPRSSTGSG